MWKWGHPNEILDPASWIGAHLRHPPKKKKKSVEKREEIMKSSETDKFLEG